MIPGDVSLPALTRLSDVHVGLLPLEMGQFTVHASLPEPWLRDAAAGRGPSIARMFGPWGEVDSSGYYRLGPRATGVSPSGARPGRQATRAPAASRAQSPGPALSHARWRPWPWLRGVDPFLLMVHSYGDKSCLVANGRAWSVTDQALGSWLCQLPGLSVRRRPLESPLVLFTCAGTAMRQALADRVGRLVLFPDGDMSIGAGRIDAKGRGTAARVIVALHRTGNGRGGWFRSAYPRGPAGDAVRLAYRLRFSSSAPGWLAERSAGPGRKAPFGARPLRFGGGFFPGLAYFDRRDRASRSDALGSSPLGSAYEAWTPNADYQPGTPAEAAGDPGQLPAAPPWNSRELGTLPFSPDAAAVVATYYAAGRFAVYDQDRDRTYWETPLAFGRRLRRDLSAASAGGAAPPRVVLLADFDAVPARARAAVARGLGGPELITVNAPAVLSLAEGPAHGTPQARIVLLPLTAGATVPEPEWTATGPAGVSARLSPAPGTGKQSHAVGSNASRFPVHLPLVTGWPDSPVAVGGLAGSVAGAERPGALTRAAAGRWVRGRGAVPTWAELEILAYQTVVRAAAGGHRDRLEAAPGRPVGRCVSLALQWRDSLFPDGIAAPTAADDLVAGRQGLLAGLAAAGGWVRVQVTGRTEVARQVEAMLAGEREGLYAMVVWEPAGQVPGHATVWHAHRVGPAVRWMTLEEGHGRWTTPRGAAAGHAYALFVSADARVLTPPAATPARAAGLRALLEVAPARPVTGTGEGQAEDEDEESSTSAHEVLSERARAHRAIQGNRHVIPGHRTVAVLQYAIDGYTGELIAVSGTTHYTGSVSVPGTRVFNARSRRRFDAECMALETLASRLHPSATGYLMLYSERDICSSCESVIQQFREMFPGISVYVYVG